MVMQKYLQQHGLSIDLSQWPDNKYWDYVLVIPVCGEADDFLSAVLQHQFHLSVLVIMIVNRPDGHVKSNQWYQDNEALIQHLSKSHSEQFSLSAGHQLFIADTNHAAQSGVLLLNFNNQPFDPNKGVGLARRIAADTALSLVVKKAIKKPWIFSTDADVKLPPGYFAAIDEVPALTSALSLNFMHHSDDQLQHGFQETYDFKLRYYQQGVKFIGAAYDYIPLGSTLIVDANSYAKVRGFPPRSGGEDFYLLNKLAKSGVIYQPPQPMVEIRSRFSDRVPFGTGPAISQIQQQQSAGELITFYHPKIFHVLKSWRSCLLNYYQQQQLPSDDCGLNEHWKLEAVLSQALTQVKSEHRWQQFVHEWFDAFKILKSVHFLRQEFNSIHYEALIQSVCYLEIMASNGDEMT
jgi:hypothetical protein